MEKEIQSNRCGGRGPRFAGHVVLGVLAGLAFAVVFGIFVKLLWNWLMPGVFGLREITYVQAIGMIVLARILFGIKGMHGMRPGPAGRRHWHDHWFLGGPCSGHDLENGGVKDWRHYDEWWDAEGREAFKKYNESREK
jgi:hypothetical protein